MILKMIDKASILMAKSKFNVVLDLGANIGAIIMYFAEAGNSI